MLHKHFPIPTRYKDLLPVKVMFFSKSVGRAVSGYQWKGPNRHRTGSVEQLVGHTWSYCCVWVQQRSKTLETRIKSKFQICWTKCLWILPSFPSSLPSAFSISSSYFEFFCLAESTSGLSRLISVAIHSTVCMPSVTWSWTLILILATEIVVCIFSVSVAAYFFHSGAFYSPDFVISAHIFPMASCCDCTPPVVSFDSMKSGSLLAKGVGRIQPYFFTQKFISSHIGPYRTGDNRLIKRMLKPDQTVVGRLKHASKELHYSVRWLPDFCVIGCSFV